MSRQRIITNLMHKHRVMMRAWRIAMIRAEKWEAYCELLRSTAYTKKPNV